VCQARGAGAGEPKPEDDPLNFDGEERVKGPSDSDVQARRSEQAKDSPFSNPDRAPPHACSSLQCVAEQGLWRHGAFHACLIHPVIARERLRQGAQLCPRMACGARALTVVLTPQHFRACSGLQALRAGPRQAAAARAAHRKQSSVLGLRGWVPLCPRMWDLGRLCVHVPPARVGACPGVVKVCMQSSAVLTHNQDLDELCGNACGRLAVGNKDS
jgi:hypothetical protein